ncbi:lysozyme inhibitor LprI family protein [Luteibacter rhizovicinus]|uniref:lysozyme inhibitor LprI family protein n=1 Tax=Luteibacter sp. dw_328 TaxID=2719796 RepID=UPI000ABDD3F9|nr:lysozyme inhibitor LprI family protein [Luteibacter rhizovicinus]
MRTFSIVVMLVIASMAGSAAAQAEDCDEASSQLSMNMCADQEFEAADKQLNATYRQVTGRLKGDQAATSLLIKAQRAWLSFRDAQCEFAASANAQGSISPMLIAQCRSAATHARTKELEALLHCEEGDMSCPVPGP